MWVIVVLWYAGLGGEYLGSNVWHEASWTSEVECKEFLHANQWDIRESVQDIKRSSVYSFACVDANKYPEVKSTFKGADSVRKGI
jgi:hypothetical protein